MIVTMATDLDFIQAPVVTGHTCTYGIQFAPTSVYTACTQGCIKRTPYMTTTAYSTLILPSRLRSGDVTFNFTLGKNGS